MLLLMSISTSLPHFLPPYAAPLTLTGRNPSFSRNLNSAPRAVNASNKGFMGLFFICSEELITYSPSDNPSIAVRNLAAVPALPTLISPVFNGIFPEVPVRITHFSSSLIFTINPRLFRHSRKCLESSLNKTPSRRHSPLESAAINNALLVILFEPGTSTTQSTGPFTGLTSY